MSKKSSIFAADLGIVPDRTIKYYRVMNKECVFRCQFNGNTYRVLMGNHPHFIGEHIYFTYKERRRLDAVHWNTLAGAIGSILCEIEPNFKDEFKIIWS